MNRSPNYHDPDDRATKREHDGISILLGAIGWLALGSGGLLWAIAFTADTASLSLALLVWSVMFVAPSIIAAFAAYRNDPPAKAADEAPPALLREPQRRRAAAAASHEARIARRNAGPRRRALESGGRNLSA